MVRIGAPLLLVCAATAGSSAAAAQVPCGRGGVTLRGQLVDQDGAPIASAMLEADVRSCLASTDGDGRFVMSGLPGGPVVLRGVGLGVCVYPQPIVWSGGRSVEVTLRGVRTRAPFDDSILVIHGGGWAPESYEALRCLAEGGTPPRPGVGADVPTPREALERSLNHPASRPVLERAAADHGTVPVVLNYGAVDGPTPPAPVPYSLDGDLTDGWVYVLIRYASDRTLDAQVGYLDFGAGSSRGRYEWGVRLKWLRATQEWDSGVAVEHWYPRPDPPPEPLTPHVVRTLAAAIDAVSAPLPSSTVLCVTLLGDPKDDEPVPPRVLNALDGSHRAIPQQECPTWWDRERSALVDSLDQGARTTPPVDHLDTHHLIVQRPHLDDGERSLNITMIRGTSAVRHRCSAERLGVEVRVSCSVVDRWTN